MNERRRVRARAIVAAIVAAAFVALAAAAGTYELELWGGRSVPSVKGIAEARATQEIQAKGLSVVIEQRPSDSGIGYVLDTEPASGKRVPEGGTVKLIVSANRTVPDLTGMSLDAARDALDDIGAQNVRVTYDSSRDEAEGTVLSVTPAEGTIITASDEVQLVVAQAPVVPDVVGKTEDDALEALDEVALTAEITYVQGSKDERGKVLSSVPAAGKVAGDDGVVQLTVVNPNPTDPHHLLEYFASETGGLPKWLMGQGYELTVGYKVSDNHAVERFEDSAGGTVTFTGTPWESEVTQSEDTEVQDVITSGAFYDGLRLEIPELQCPDSGATQVSTQKVIEACGFGEASDACTQADITKPTGISSPRANFYCASGTQDSYTWVVLVESTSGTKTRAVCLAAPTDVFERQTLSDYGDSVCDFVAYQEMYGGRS